MLNTLVRDDILTTIKNQHGILFATPTIVFREAYSGRDIIAKNSRFEKGYVDNRGYVPVELWIMSITEAENGVKIKDEGLTKINLTSGRQITLKEAAKIAENEMFGTFYKKWPLTKILDIGGQPRKTSFSTNVEVPSIPVHVHSGMIINGKSIGHGKDEAYFFPPLDVSPYNKNIGKVISRLGLKKNITKEEFKKRLKQFGKGDSMYMLLQEYDITPFTGWTIPAGTIHAPGPWVTVEIQLPQDDYNLASWRLGEKMTDKKDREELYQKLVLRGLKNEDDFIEQLVNWENSTDPNFKKKFFRETEIIEESKQGKRYQIFFDQFYGEGWEVAPGETMQFNKTKPVGGIVWSGSGLINGNSISDFGVKDFFVVPKTTIEIKNLRKTPLMIFTVEPLVI